MKNQRSQRLLIFAMPLVSLLAVIGTISFEYGRRDKFARELVQMEQEHHRLLQQLPEKDRKKFDDSDTHKD